MRVSDTYRKYPDEWVALLVLRTDKYDVPLGGEVIAHTPDRPQLDKQVIAYRAEHKEARIYIFFTGELIPKDVSVCFVAR